MKSVKAFLLILQADSLTTSSSGAVFGNLWFSVEGVSFPEEGWNDFAVVLLGSWCSEVEGILRGSKTSAQLEFMEGSFCVQLTRSSDDGVHVEFRENDLTQSSWVVHTSDLRREMAAVGAVVLSYCVHQGIGGSDVEFLRGVLARL